MISKRIILIGVRKLMVAFSRLKLNSYLPKKLFGVIEAFHIFLDFASSKASFVSGVGILALNGEQG
jgi:hypothetical protein